MNIHEYQGKKILADYGLPVAEGVLVSDKRLAASLVAQLPGPLYVVKSQIHAGGRGKGRFKELGIDAPGGVRLARSVEEAVLHIEQMLGKTLCTEQTGSEGKKVDLLYIEDGADIDRELYLSLLVDPVSDKVCFIASTEGGMDIEKIARDHPEKIFRLPVGLASGLLHKEIEELICFFNLEGKAARDAEAAFPKLYKMFVEKDMSLLEINPLIVMKNGRIRFLDVKISFDDNALFRHPDLASLRDISQEDPKEIEASKYGLSYIALNGNIGCMVNGAGLAMATMDIIKLHGAEPANFLDVGGGASKESVVAALKIIAADTSVRAILVNIFGGIMRCDLIASAIVEAVEQVGIPVPIIVRLQGTNVDLGRKILQSSKLDVLVANDLEDAAQKVVGAVKQ